MGKQAKLKQLRKVAKTLPLNTPKSELEALPPGSVIRFGAGYWEKHDENELISRKQAREQVQATLDAFTKDILSDLEKAHKEDREMEDAIMQEDAEKRCIFSALLFVGDESWDNGLEILRNRYNTAAAKALDIARKRKQQARGRDTELEAGYAHLEFLLLRNSSNLNEAVRKAIGEGDKGAALRQLNAEEDGNILDALRELLGNVKTENIATHRSFDRGSVWIGWQCNILEDTKQIKDIEAMWKTLHARLRVNRETLAGDELAAWKWFEQREPFNLIGTERRQLNKEISRFKQQMKPYYEQRIALDKTRDKG